ncbi:SRPBCC family protein [Parafilimonas terrae]|uniref:Ligand-binding SRPBCC domain-containing protein n=1 Tax=Parafilimonas terrae TaxID=1465490 RepID=A0A1I5RSM0_9BACT|nr:SRPBCC family protein [Parafilimonas terrae]SFP61493.1 Ligand-binding SRPBCC domain-containing protein [Parafilimonas terrae]
MPVVNLQTRVNAPIEICFDLSRSINLHTISTAQTKEKAIAGRTSGLIELSETVTWQATHFGIKQKLTSKITAYERPFHFRDEQVKGAFKYIKHDHYFIQDDGFVIMKDVFEFGSPLGLLGKLADKFVLTKYLTGFLLRRNNLIKEYAETEKWKTVLDSSAY